MQKTYLACQLIFTSEGPASRPQRRTSDDWARTESVNWFRNTNRRHYQARKAKKSGQYENNSLLRTRGSLWLYWSV